MQGNRMSVARAYCLNCGQLLVGLRDERSTIKFRCRTCGLAMVSRRISRRHERVDVMSSAGI